MDALTPLPTAPEALLARLEALGIAAETHSHPPVFTVEEAQAHCSHMPGGHCKNLFLKDEKGRLWLVVALDDSAVDLKALPKAIGSARLSFGKPELLWEALGVRPGSVTPFALINDPEHHVSVVLEERMMALSPLNYHPLSNDRTTALTPSDLLRFIAACGHEPQVVALPLRSAA